MPKEHVVMADIVVRQRLLQIQTFSGKVPLNKNLFTFPLLFCMRNYNSKADATAAKRPQHVVMVMATTMC